MSRARPLVACAISLVVLPAVAPAPAVASPTTVRASASCSTADGTARAVVTYHRTAPRRWYADVHVDKVWVGASTDGGRAVVALEGRSGVLARRVQVADALVTDLPVTSDRVEPLVSVVVDPGATGRTCRVVVDL